MGTQVDYAISGPNGTWVQAQVDSGDFASPSAVINDLIRQARERDAIRTHLLAAERSGFTDQTPEQIRAAAKAELRRNGEL